MAKKSLKSLKILREGHAENLPVYPSDAASEVPDRLKSMGAREERDKSNAFLPTYASDASSEVPDSLDNIGPRAVKPAFDGKAIAQASAKHGAAEADEIPDEDELEDEHVGEVKDDELQTLPEEDEKDDVEKELDKVEEAVDDELEKDDDKEKLEEDSDKEDAEEKDWQKKIEEEEDKDKEDAEEKEEEEEEKEDEEEKKEVKEHLAAITSGNFLSEENKIKVQTLFETAVNSTVNRKVLRERKKIRRAYRKATKNSIKRIHESLVDKVDSYLDYIVEEWLKDNQVAIETSLQTELAEEFMFKLKNLLEDHFVEVPESKRDLYRELQEKNSVLEKELNEEINKNINLKKRLNENEKEDLVTNLCVGLTDLEAAKFRKLVEAVEFVNKDEFDKKLNIIKESYFGVSSKASDDISSILVEEGGIDSSLNSPHGEMDVYVDAISRSLKKHLLS